MTASHWLESVSRETRDRLEVYVEMLGKWNTSINIVAKSTLNNVWQRHIIDSLQIADVVEEASHWVDLGSGGGLPGLIIAAKKAENSPNTHITMVESDQRKCAFIAAAADAMNLDVTIQCRRIEESTSRTYDVVSARALASLPSLLDLALPYRHNKTICIFPKGAKADQEMNTALKTWNVNFDTVQSVTDPSSTIFRIQEYSRVA